MSSFTKKNTICLPWNAFSNLLSSNCWPTSRPSRKAIHHSWKICTVDSLRYLTDNRENLSKNAEQAALHASSLLLCRKCARYSCLKCVIKYIMKCALKTEKNIKISISARSFTTCNLAAIWKSCYRSCWFCLVRFALYRQHTNNRSFVALLSAIARS